jgi:hypothetical protein
MPNRVSMNSTGVGWAQNEDRVRSGSAPRTRHLPRHSATRRRPGDGPGEQPLSESDVRASLERVRSAAATRPAHSLRIASSGLDAGNSVVVQTHHDTGGDASQLTGR